MTRRFYNFYIDEELADGLKVIKARDGISESEQIRRAIRAWLKSKRHKVKPRKGGTRTKR